MVFKSPRLTEGAVLVQNEFVGECWGSLCDWKISSSLHVGTVSSFCGSSGESQGGVVGKFLSAEFIMVWLLACMDLLVSLEIWRLHENFGADIAFKASLSCVCVLANRLVMKAFLCIPYFHSVSVASFPVGWPTVFSEGIKFGPCCSEQLRTNMWLLLEVLLGKWNCCPIFLLELFWEPLLCPLWVKTSLSQSWNLSILASSPSPIRPFSNFWSSLRPSSVPFFQEWSLTGEYSVPSVIWCISLIEGLGFLNKFLPLPMSLTSTSTIWTFKFAEETFLLVRWLWSIYWVSFYFLACPLGLCNFPNHFPWLRPGTPAMWRS